MSGIPIVRLPDLAAHDAETVAAVHDSLRDLGLFYLDTRPVADDAQVEEVVREARAFFCSPAAVKDAISVARSASFRGYVGVGEESTNGVADLKESWEFGRESEPPADMATADWAVMYGGNQYPDPAVVPGFAEAVSSYTDWVSHVGRAVVESLARTLGQPRALGEGGVFGNDLHWFSRLISYRDVGEFAGEEVRLGAHTDSCLLTISVQDVAGLEVQSRDGTWHLVEPPPHACVVFTGELMGLWSGGYYSACRHRVHNSALGGDRISAITFFIPALESRLTPLSDQDLVGSGVPAAERAGAADNPWLLPGEDPTASFVVGEREWARVHEIFPSAAGAVAGGEVG